MVTNILWSNYLVVVVLVLASWYLFVGLRFYLKVLKDIAAGKRKVQMHVTKGKWNEDSANDLRNLDSMEIISLKLIPGASATIFREVYGLVKGLKDVLTDASQRKLVKQEFEDYLRLILKGYPLLRASPYRSAIDELIATECEKHGPVLLTQQEVEALWNEKN